MINRFTQMIKDGIAPMRYRSWGKDTSKPDLIANQYNNVWGVASDTHMERDGERYIITGSLIRDPKIWDTFRSVTSWRCVDFPITMNEWISSIGFTGTYDILNGDTIFCVCKPKENQQPVA